MKKMGIFNSGVNRLQKLLITCWFSFLWPFCLQAQLLYFATNDNAITIIGGFNDGTGTVNIPSNINGLPVRAIGDSAFMDRSGVRRVIIPDSVTSIGNSAFSGCRILRTVVIGHGVTYIGSDAFRICPLTTVKIPDSVTNIGESAFQECTSLSKLVIPDSVITIGDFAFYHCAGLTSVVVGNGVTSIGNGAFSACTRLESVTLGRRVASIGNNAFSFTGLTSVVIPKSLNALGDFVFDYSTRLTNVLFEGNRPPEPRAPFEQAEPTIYFLPDTVGWGATYGNRPARLIPFVYTSDGHGVTITGYRDPFIGDALNVPDSIDGLPVGAIGTGAFSNRLGLTRVTFPDSVTNIRSAAFHGCTSLTNVTIGKNVMGIQDLAFADCPSLTLATFEGNSPPEVGTIFSGASPVVYFLPGTTGWRATYAGRPTFLWNPSVSHFNRGFGLNNEKFGFNISGTPGLSLVVERSTNLAQMNWKPISRINLVGGTSLFVDPVALPNVGALYRFRTP